MLKVEQNQRTFILPPSPPALTYCNNLKSLQLNTRAKQQNHSKKYKGLMLYPLYNPRTPSFLEMLTKA